MKRLQCVYFIILVMQFNCFLRVLEDEFRRRAKDGHAVSTPLGQAHGNWLPARPRTGFLRSIYTNRLALSTGNWQLTCGFGWNQGTTWSISTAKRKSRRHKYKLVQYTNGWSENLQLNFQTSHMYTYTQKLILRQSFDCLLFLNLLLMAWMPSMWFRTLYFI